MYVLVKFTLLFMGSARLLCICFLQAKHFSDVKLVCNFPSDVKIVSAKNAVSL